ncbi:hypothetical protein Zmor_008754 [Zophobas morio]|jgi:hypothetical protein|uniref:Uncharacterized protein n=1 Tax=Zophobas morio TaxID=2755281 RepID=A0AA38LZ77_9CUCU|nr:hypothetical protein Zmor_008754 [Zophobas morio]
MFPAPLEKVFSVPPKFPKISAAANIFKEGAVRKLVGPGLCLVYLVPVSEKLCEVVLFNNGQQLGNGVHGAVNLELAQLEKHVFEKDNSWNATTRFKLFKFLFLDEGKTY